MIKAVIFDLDGVIADSEPFSAEADDILLARYGIRKTEQERRDMYGRRFEEIYGDILRARGLDLDIKELFEAKSVIFRGLIRGRLKPIRNSLELIGFFQKKGFLTALATSSHLAKALPEMRELGIERLFGIIVSGDEVKAGKPDPEIFLRASVKLGVLPKECAVIEDSAFGVRAAKAAGMFAIAFRSPNTPDQDLSKADLVVGDLLEAKEYFVRQMKGGKC